MRFVDGVWSTLRSVEVNLISGPQKENVNRLLQAVPASRVTRPRRELGILIRCGEAELNALVLGRRKGLE